MRYSAVTRSADEVMSPAVRDLSSLPSSSDSALSRLHGGLEADPGQVVRPHGAFLLARLQVGVTLGDQDVVRVHPAVGVGGSVPVAGGRGDFAQP